MFERVEIDGIAAADIPVPAHIAEYVEILGIELSVQFLLHFGGAPLYVPAEPKGRGELEAFVGTANARALAARADRLPARVPLAKPWIAAVMQASGANVSQIARRLHVTDVAVRWWLA